MQNQRVRTSALLPGPLERTPPVARPGVHFRRGGLAAVFGWQLFESPATVSTTAPWIRSSKPFSPLQVHAVAGGTTLEGRHIGALGRRCHYILPVKNDRWVSPSSPQWSVARNRRMKDQTVVISAAYTALPRAIFQINDVAKKKVVVGAPRLKCR